MAGASPKLTTKLKGICIGIAADRLVQPKGKRFEELQDVAISTMEWVLKHPSDFLHYLQNGRETR